MNRVKGKVAKGGRVERGLESQKRMAAQTDITLPEP